MWQITVEGPRYLGTDFSLQAGDTTLGRADENDIPLTGNSVSRHHARLHATETQLWVFDLGSRNGVRVNARRIDGSASLAPGDSLALGDYVVTIRQPARVENAFSATVDLRAGGLRRSSQQLDLSRIRTLARPADDSALLASVEDFLASPSRMGDEPISKEHRTVVLLVEQAEGVESAAQLQELIDEALRWGCAHLGMSAGAALLRHRSGAMVPVAVRVEAPSQGVGELSVSDPLIATAANDRRSLAVADSRGDERLLCVPILDEGDCRGVLYFRREGGEDAQLMELLDACNALASVVTSGMRRYLHADREGRQKRMRETLDRCNAPDILRLRRGGPRLEPRQLTVLAADISGFQKLVSSQPPAVVADVLSEFYEKAMATVFSFRGVVDKVVGDCLVALFGSVEPGRDHAQRGLRCALELRRAWTEASSRRPEAQRTYLQIGLSSGEALVGVVGSDLRQDFTAVGEPVNLASWICQGSSPEQVVVTREVLDLAASHFETIPLRERMFRKLKRRIPLFDVLQEERGQVTITMESPPQRGR